MEDKDNVISVSKCTTAFRLLLGFVIYFFYPMSKKKKIFLRRKFSSLLGISSHRCGWDGHRVSAAEWMVIEVHGIARITNKDTTATMEMNVEGEPDHSDCECRQFDELRNIAEIDNEEIPTSNHTSQLKCVCASELLLLEPLLLSAGSLVPALWSDKSLWYESESRPVLYFYDPEVEEKQDVTETVVEPLFVKKGRRNVPMIVYPSDYNDNGVYDINIDFEEASAAWKNTAGSGAYRFGGRKRKQRGSDDEVEEEEEEEYRYVEDSSEVEEEEYDDDDEGEESEAEVDSEDSDDSDYFDHHDNKSKSKKGGKATTEKKKQEAPLKEGSLVRLKDLKTEGYNGKLAVIKSKINEKGRYMVELQGNVVPPLLQQIYVNPMNMVLEPKNTIKSKTGPRPASAAAAEKKKQEAPLKEGSLVRLKDLKTEGYNGKLAVIKSKINEKGRYMVELQGNVAHPLLQQIYVNPVNMVLEQVKGSVTTNGVERKGDVQRSSSSSSSKRVEEPDVIDLAGDSSPGSPINARPHPAKKPMPAQAMQRQGTGTGIVLDLVGDDDDDDARGNDRGGGKGSRANFFSSSSSYSRSSSSSSSNSSNSNRENEPSIVLPPGYRPHPSLLAVDPSHQKDKDKGKKKKQQPGPDPHVSKSEKKPEAKKAKTESSESHGQRSMDSFVNIRK